MTTIALIKSDIKKYQKYGSNLFVILFFTQSFWAIFQYRLAHSIYKLKILYPLKKILLSIMLVYQKFIEITTGISIPYSAEIGHSFYIGHFGGIILNSKVKIGNNCNISQGVTIGVTGLNEKRGVPIIGNNVYIGANSVVVGKIFIENNVLIGACSLVNTSIKENDIVIGVPAKTISNKGSIGYI